MAALTVRQLRIATGATVADVTEDAGVVAPPPHPHPPPAGTAADGSDAPGCAGDGGGYDAAAAAAAARDLDDGDAWPPALPPPSFLVDVALGRLVRWLRAVGVDAARLSDVDAGASVSGGGATAGGRGAALSAAARTGRILLTRDSNVRGTPALASAFCGRARRLAAARAGYCGGQHRMNCAGC